MGKKGKRARRAEAGRASLPAKRSREQRHEECVQIASKLAQLGLSTEIEGVAKLHAIMRAYVDDGLSASGGIKLHGLKRTLCYVLSTRQHVECSVNLQHTPRV